MICNQVLLQMLMLLIAATAASSKMALPGCPDRCGNITIPYPFGIGPGCSRDGFNILCNETHYSPPKPFLSIEGIEVIDLLLQSGQAHIYKKVAWACYNQSGLVESYLPDINFQGRTLFKLSDTFNKFTVIGCSTLAYILGHGGYESGCVSICENASRIKDGPCSGMGCCQTTIPKGLGYYNVQFAGYDHRAVWNFSPCSYAFLVDKDRYMFRASDLTMDKNSRVPMVLDWAIRDEKTCKLAMLNMTSYACRSKNSECHEITHGYGYLCSCSRGYHGNPYIPNGCRDINECLRLDRNSCYGICSNMDGSYNCSCPPGMHGNPREKDGCNPDQDPSKSRTSLMLTLPGIVISIFFLAVLSFWTYIGFEKRKLIREKQKFFEQNGGLLLQQQLNLHKGVTFKIFTKEELGSATNKFEASRILGCGGNSIVYKGILEDNRKVAIKKSKMMSETKNKEFAKEMLILSHINHKNVVKLLGCCLEVEVPMLVYEFISNGTLAHYIHDPTRRSPIPLDTRLRIAAESAEALAYLHSSASPPILHGDVKPSNILLDDNYTAKVSDFGYSQLAPVDETQLATQVRGTWGYLDPEYIRTSLLTEKSDVYSFGVVLLELLTGKKAIYFKDFEEEGSHTPNLLSVIKENLLLEILDDQIKNDGPTELLQEVAQLARQCLSVKRDERPTMKEVAEALDKLRRFRQRCCVQQNSEKTETFHSKSNRHILGDRMSD